MSITRRDVFAGVAGSIVMAAAVPALAAPGGAKVKKPLPAFVPGAHQPVPLPFDATKLSGLSEKLLVSHHDNNYVGAVKNLNKVELELAKVGKTTEGYLVSSLRERELTYTNSMILHERYFGNLGGDGKAVGDVATELGAAYGSLARWEEQFRATAMSLGGGSGWVILDLELHDGRLRTYASSSHSQSVAFGVPLLVLDMYEHAYALDYGAGHAKYIDAAFANLHWEEIERRYQRARQAAQTLRG